MNDPTPTLTAFVCPHCGHRAGEFVPDATVRHDCPKNRNRSTRYQPVTASCG